MNRQVKLDNVQKDFLLVSVSISFLADDARGLPMHKEFLTAYVNVLKKKVFANALVANVNGNDTRSGVYKWLRNADIHMHNFQIIQSPKSNGNIHVY